MDGKEREGYGPRLGPVGGGPGPGTSPGVPRTVTGLRSRRELGSFYMRRKENGETVGIGPGGGLGGVAVSGGSPGGGLGGESVGRPGFSARRAPSFARGINLGVAGGPGTAGGLQKNAQIMESFAKLGPAERQQLVQDLEKRVAGQAAGAGIGVTSGRRSLPRPRSRSLDPMDNSMAVNLSVADSIVEPEEERFIENPVEVSNRSNLSDFSDAEEVESEDLEGETREVGEEVERWLSEGYNVENHARGGADVPKALSTALTSPALGGTLGAGSEKKCANCDQHMMKVTAMESTMARMQNEMAELRVRLRKAEKKAKSWGVKIGYYKSSKKSSNGSTDTKGMDSAYQTPPKLPGDPSKGGSETEQLKLALTRLTAKLEDTEMERDHYKQAAKLHLEHVINNEESR